MFHFRISLCLAGLLASAAVLAAEQSVYVPNAEHDTSAAPEHFTGRVTVRPLFEQTAPARSYGAVVTFEAGARTHWHSHPLGQTLIVTSGRGLTQYRLSDGTLSPVRTLQPGAVVTCPPNVMHWHGAADDSEMSHIAISEHAEQPVIWGAAAEVSSTANSTP